MLIIIRMMANKTLLVFIITLLQCCKSSSFDANTSSLLLQQEQEAKLADVDDDGSASTSTWAAVLFHHHVEAGAAATSTITSSAMHLDLPTDEKTSEYQAKIFRLLQVGWNPGDGFRIPMKETASILITDASFGRSRPSTYGEVTALGVRQLLYFMKLHEEKSVSFLDMGSGVGKLVAQVYLEVPEVIQVVGVELSTTRHALAREAWDSMRLHAESLRQEHYGKSSAVLNLIQGDLFELDLEGVTHVYVSSLCFSAEMVERLAEKLISREGTSLQCIASLKKFPSSYEKDLGKPVMEYVQMTWTRSFGSPVYFYRPP